MYHLIKIIHITLIAFYCSGLYAENSVDLFDQHRGQENKAEPVKKIIPQQKKKLRSRRDWFSLTGISKIGDKYVIYFNTNKGKRDNFTWYKNQKSPPARIFNDYEIDKIIDRTVYLNIINNKACIEDQKNGISCDKKNKQMLMQLVRKKATLKRPPSRATRSETKKPKIKTKKSSRVYPFRQKKNDGG